MTFDGASEQLGREMKPSTHGRPVSTPLSRTPVAVAGGRSPPTASLGEGRRDAEPVGHQTTLLDIRNRGVGVVEGLGRGRVVLCGSVCKGYQQYRMRSTCDVAQVKPAFTKL